MGINVPPGAWRLGRSRLSVARRRCPSPAPPRPRLSLMIRGRIRGATGAAQISPPPSPARLRPHPLQTTSARPTASQSACEHSSRTWLPSPRPPPVRPLRGLRDPPPAHTSAGLTPAPAPGQSLDSHLPACAPLTPSSPPAPPVACPAVGPLGPPWPGRAPSPGRRPHATPTWALPSPAPQPAGPEAQASALPPLLFREGTRRSPGPCGPHSSHTDLRALGALLPPPPERPALTSARLTLHFPSSPSETPRAGRPSFGLLFPWSLSYPPPRLTTCPASFGGSTRPRAWLLSCTPGSPAPEQVPGEEGSRGRLLRRFCAHGLGPKGTHRGPTPPHGRPRSPGARAALGHTLCHPLLPSLSGTERLVRSR